jgi:hypothetical protein
VIDKYPKIKAIFVGSMPIKKKNLNVGK